MGDPDVTTWTTHNVSNTFNSTGSELPSIGKDLSATSKLIHDRVTRTDVVPLELDASLAGNYYLTAGHDWHAGSNGGDFDEVYKSSTLNTDWYSFDIHRGATVKVIYEGACATNVSNYLESIGYTYNGKSSGNYIRTFTACGGADCNTMYYKHFDIPAGQEKVTISMPSFQNKEFFVVIDFDDYK